MKHAGLMLPLQPVSSDKPGLAHGPHEVGFVRGLQNQSAQAKPALFQLRQPVGHILKKFDDQNGFARLVVQFEQIAHGLKLPLAARLVEQRPVNVLDGGGFQIEQGFRWPASPRLTEAKNISPTPRSSGSGTIFSSAEKMPASVPSLPARMGSRFAGSCAARASA